MRERASTDWRGVRSRLAAFSPTGNYYANCVGSTANYLSSILIVGENTGYALTVVNAKRNQRDFSTLVMLKK